MDNIINVNIAIDFKYMKEILKFVKTKVVLQIRSEINLHTITKWVSKSVLSALNLTFFWMICAYFVIMIKKNKLKNIRILKNKNKKIRVLWDKNNAVNVMLIMSIKMVYVFIVIIKNI